MYGAAAAAAVFALKVPSIFQPHRMQLMCKQRQEMIYGMQAAELGRLFHSEAVTVLAWLHLLCLDLWLARSAQAAVHASLIMLLGLAAN